MEPGEARIRKRHWRRDATNRCCFCASWFGWVQRYHQMHCCGAGCPTSTPVVIMRTLQASLDLNDDRDKVIFRQFGGESSLRTLQSGHARSFVPTNLIPMVGSFQKSQNCVRTTMKDAQQITCQSSLICTRDPDAWTTIHQQETMTQHLHAVADHCRRQHLTTTDLRDLIRQFFPPHHFGSRVVKKRTVFFKTMSGIYGRALNATSPGEIQRHGTLWTIKQWKRLAHYMVYVRCAAFFDTLSREFLMLIPRGRSEDIQLALRRREQREMKEKRSNVANLLEAQWVRGKALPRGNWGNRGRRRRTIAIIHRLRSRMEATR